jgi:muconolactone delta-isomerase
MKFLVMWRIEIALMSRGVVDAVLKMADYAKPLEESHKVLSRYHIPGAHGGAWIYEVDSNEELDMLLARSPVYNVARYEVFPLAEMILPKLRTST